MDRPIPAAEPLQTLPAALVRAELQSVLAGAAFAGGRNHRALLSHLVERCLAGDTASLKETLLAIEVFRRPVDRFDPARDTIVRVEARRLRQRLARHYAGAGRGALLRLTLPSGQYVPQAVVQRPPPDAGPAPRPEEAAELVERGEYLLRQGSEDGCRRALQRFERAAAMDPRLVAAHFGVARAHSALVGMTFEAPLPAIERAEAALARVLALAPRHADALAHRASIRHRYALDWPAAERLYDEAIAAAPGSAHLHHQLAFSLMFVRRFDDAEAELRLARRLDPMNVSVRAHQALLALYRRDYAAGERHLLALLDLQPQALAVSMLGYLHLLRGNAGAALKCYAQAEQAFPQLSIGAIGRAQALALSGRDGEARATVQALRERWAPRYLPPYQLALVAVRLGDADEALARLEQAAAERDSNFVCLPVDPGLDPLRGHPRFAALEGRTGVMPAASAAAAAPSPGMR